MNYLLCRIESLRKQLNEKIDTTKNIPKIGPHTYELSTKLDKLINLYMNRQW